MSGIEFEPVWECPFCYAENGESGEVCWHCEEIRPAHSLPAKEQP